MDFKEGVYEGLPFEEYNEIPAYRASDLKDVSRCVYSWKNKRGFKESPALLEGRVQHTCFLEHENFHKEFIIEPEINKRTKAGKEEYAQFLEGVGNLTPITSKMYEECMDRREILQEFIPSEDHKVELTLCYMYHGHPFKSRLDWHDGESVWDLKTCRDASPRGFRTAINMFRYHMQASLYIDACRILGMPAESFFFLAQEKLHPYPYAVYTLTPEAITYGQAKNEQALSTLLEAEKNDSHNPFNVEGVQTIDLNELW
jgi:exodeoxyribonuclease VIII|tara:strand:- start:1123 stop:1896 length:774 start_codon:yes stop_codon:yes gene_type:complete